MYTTRFPLIASNVPHIKKKFNYIDEAVLLIQEYYPGIIVREGSCGHWSFCVDIYDSSRIVAEAETTRRKNSLFTWDLRIKKPEANI